MTRKRLFICYSQDATAKNQTNNLSKPTWQLGIHLRYATPAFPPAQDKSKPRRTGHRTGQFLTFAVANLVSLSDLGFLCRCSISLSESNSPLHTNSVKCHHTKLHLASKTRRPLHPLSLTHLRPLSYHEFRHKCFLLCSGCSSCVGYPLQKSPIFIFQVLLFAQSLTNIGDITMQLLLQKNSSHASWPKQVKQPQTFHQAPHVFSPRYKQTPSQGSILGSGCWLSSGNTMINSRALCPAAMKSCLTRG